MRQELVKILIVASIFFTAYKHKELSRLVEKLTRKLFSDKDILFFTNFFLVINGKSSELAYCFYELLESGLKNFLKRILKAFKEGVFIDIGAHIGYYTLLVSKESGGKVSVVAFEPVKDNFKRLTRNVRINNCKNVIIEPFPLSNTSRNVRIFRGNDSFTHSLSPTLYTSRFSISSFSITLDEYLSSKEFHPNIIKIDVEGHEREVLEGMKKTIKKYAPIIIVEFHPNTIDFKSKKWNKLFNFLKKYYSFYLLYEGRLLKTNLPNSISALRNKYRMIIYPHFIFLPLNIKLSKIL